MKNSEDSLYLIKEAVTRGDTIVDKTKIKEIVIQGVKYMVM